MNQLQKEILYSDSTMGKVVDLIAKTSPKENKEINNILDRILPDTITPEERTFIFEEFFDVLNIAKIDNFYQGVEFAMELIKQ